MKCRKIFNRRTGAGFAAVLMAASLVMAVPVYAAEEEEGSIETEMEVQKPEASGERGVDMSTAYPGTTVKAGENVTFSLDFASLDGEGHDVALSAESLPEGWSGYFKGGNNQITRVHVAGTSNEADGAVQEGLADFNLTVPAEAEEGSYDVTLKADAGDGGGDILELEVTVSAEEVGESTFTSEYPEQQGATGSTFSFDTTIVNNRATAQTYSLSAQTPEGWQASFTPSGESAAVTSLPVEAGASQGVTVTITPPENVEKGDYEISCSAVSSNDTLKAELAVSITGTYSLAVSTPDQRLSFDAYANKQASVTLSITNTGNVDLENINLTSSAPTDWDVTFSESTIDTLEAGATKEVTAYVTPTKDAITGDYVTSITASNSDTAAGADFRVSVKTPTTWGFAAAAIIVVLVCALAAIFKKYGRR